MTLPHTLFIRADADEKKQSKANPALIVSRRSFLLLFMLIY